MTSQTQPSRAPLRAFLACVSAVLLALCPEGARAAGARIVADATTGHILLAEGADQKLQVASLTKIATACVTLDWLESAGRQASEKAAISPNAAATPGQNPIGFLAGDSASLRDLLYASMMQSDNIAAQAIAEHVGQFLPGEGAAPVRFVAQMNALARRLGMTRTLFLNPHGLDGLEKKLPHSTAADIARLTRYAMAKPAFRFYVSQGQRDIAILRGGASLGYTLRNTNELLGSRDIDGVKTGTSRRAGECLALSSLRSPESRQEGNQFIVTPRRLIVVILGSGARFREGGGLVERGWELYDAWAASGRPTKKGSSL